VRAAAAGRAATRRAGAVRSSGRRSARAARGQASVELVALLPVVVAVALGILQALAAGLARELAGHAAQSAAVAIAEGRDGAAAAQQALPGWARSRVDVTVHDTRVRVRLKPPSLLPGMADRLASSAVADAGGGT
jgi:hypothetical protein